MFGNYNSKDDFQMKYSSFPNHKLLFGYDSYSGHELVIGMKTNNNYASFAMLEYSTEAETFKPAITVYGGQFYWHYVIV